MINALMQHNEYFRMALYLTCILCLIIGICLPMYIVEIISRIRRHYRNKNEMVHFLKIYKEHALPMANFEGESFPTLDDVKKGKSYSIEIHESMKELYANHVKPMATFVKQEIK